MIKSTGVLFLVALFTLLVTACGSDDPTLVPPATEMTESTPIVTEGVPSAVSDDPGSLIVLTHDSFDIGQEVIEEFQKKRENN